MRWRHPWSVITRPREVTSRYGVHDQTSYPRILDYRSRSGMCFTTGLSPLTHCLIFPMLRRRSLLRERITRSKKEQLCLDLLEGEGDLEGAAQDKHSLVKR